jgi:hypothetical protein
MRVADADRIVEEFIVSGLVSYLFSVLGSSYYQCSESCYQYLGVMYCHCWRVICCHCLIVTYF